MNTCEKCYRTLLKCQGCNGRPQAGGILGPLTCSRCRNTGVVCPDHQGHWKK